MKKGLTEIVFVIDCSESMKNEAEKVIADFNNMQEKYRAECAGALVTTILFNERSRIFHDRVNITTAKLLTREDYRISGKTAVWDAMGNTIKHISTIQKYAREEDKPEHTIFIVYTDGLEDASKRYSCDEIEKSIQRRAERYGWQFIFMGVSLEAMITACRVHKENEPENLAGESESENDMDEYLGEIYKIFGKRGF